ncbi:MAG: hypothetical protein IJL66_05560 [Lachnospiraceae bacterium]|nr:hypothetical protein [Lachnospiraceae bacterium]
MPKKYANCIYDIPWPSDQGFEEKHRLLMIDKGGPTPTKFLSNATWYLKASPNGKGHHVSDCPEMLSWIGGDPENPFDLNGEIVVYMNGEKHVLDKSFYLQTPAFVPHCPYEVTRVDVPMIHIATPCSNTMKVTQLPELALREKETHYYDRYFVTDPQGDPLPAVKGEVKVLYADGAQCPGGIVTRASWFKEDVPDGIVPVHKHEYDELLLFLGSDYEAPFDLNAEITFSIGGEEFTITKSSYVAIPPGVEHGPFVIQNMKRPVFMAAFHDSPFYNQIPV